MAPLMKERRLCCTCPDTVRRPSRRFQRTDVEYQAVAPPSQYSRSRLCQRKQTPYPSSCRTAAPPPKSPTGPAPYPNAETSFAVRLRGLLESGSIFLEPGGPILFELGSIIAAPRVDGRVTPGVDAAVARMRAGEVGRLLVPSDAGYGRGLSLYGTQRPGSKRLGSPPARRFAMK